MQLLLFVSLIGIVAVVKGDSSSASRSSASSSTSSAESGTGTVTVTTVTSLSTCPRGTTNPCTGTLRLCKITTTPAPSSQCGLFASTTTTAVGAPFSFTYENAVTPSVSITCPGTCIFSAVQTTFVDGVATIGSVTEGALFVTGSTSFSSILTTPEGFTIPVSGTINCS